MRIGMWVSAVALAATGALMLPGGSAFAAAGDECVKVLGYEWSGEKARDKRRARERRLV